MVGVHATRRTEIGKFKIATSIFNAFPQHVQHATTRNLFAQTLKEFRGCLRTILAFQSLIHVRLRVSNKLQRLIGYQTKGFIVVSKV